MADVEQGMNNAPDTPKVDDFTAVMEKPGDVEQGTNNAPDTSTVDDQSNVTVVENRGSRLTYNLPEMRGTGRGSAYYTDSYTDIGAHMILTFVMEVVASFSLIFAVICCECLGSTDVLFVAFANGLAEMMTIYGYGGFACDFNPAVTISFLASGNCTIAEAAVKICAQFLGGMLAAISLLAVVTPEKDVTGRFSCLEVMPGATLGNIWIAETMATAMIVFVIYQTAASNFDCDNTKLSATLAHPQAVAWTVMLGVSMTFPLDGSSVNPQRAFATAIAGSIRGVDHIWHGMEAFIFAPILGGILVGLTERFFMDYLRKNLAGGH